MKKGDYYHSSMLVTGVCNLLLPSFGLPFVTASLPHSPQFTKALTDYDKTVSPQRVVKVHESRVAPLIVYIVFHGVGSSIHLGVLPCGSGEWDFDLCWTARYSPIYRESTH